MIQRIQSILLFVITIAMGLAIFLPIWGETNDIEKTRTELNAIAMIHSVDGNATQTTSTVYLAILAGVIALISLWNIFNYKNRVFQMKVAFFTTLLACIFVGISTYLTYTYDELIPNQTNVSFGIGFFMPIVALVANQIAIRFINRDERMVRSADRLR